MSGEEPRVERCAFVHSPGVVCKRPASVHGSIAGEPPAIAHPFTPPAPDPTPSAALVEADAHVHKYACTTCGDLPPDPASFRPAPPPAVDGTRCGECGGVEDDVFHVPCLVGGPFHYVKTCHPFKERRAA